MAASQNMDDGWKWLAVNAYQSVGVFHSFDPLNNSWRFFFQHQLFSFQFHHQSVIHFRKYFVGHLSISLVSFTPSFFFFFWYRRWDFVQSTGLCAEGLTYIPSVSHVSYPLTYLLAYKYRNTSLLQKKTIMVILVYKPWKWREKQGLCALTHILN